MRLIFIFLFIALSLRSFSQDCNDPHCQRLLGSLKQIELLNNTIENERVNLRRVNNSLKIQKESNDQNQSEMLRLQNDYNNANERINQLVSDLNIKQSEYNVILEDVKKLMNQNNEWKKTHQALVRLVEELESERAAHEDEGNDGIAKRNDLEIRNFMGTWISDIELGYEKDGKTIVMKTYDAEKVSYVKPGWFGKNLNRVNLKGDLFVNKKKGIVPDAEIKGKILVYSDHTLIDVLDNSLQLVVEEKYETFSHYKIKYQEGNILNRKVNEKVSALVRVAFVDDEKYEKNKNEFNSFWDAKNNGLLKMTTIQPKFPNIKLTDNEIVKNAMMIGTDKIAYDVITLEIFDYGKVDGDRATFYLNNEPLITNLNLGKRDKAFIKSGVKLRKGKNYLTIFANDTGTAEPCTAAINIKDAAGNVLKSIKLSAKVGYCEKFELELNR